MRFRIFYFVALLGGGLTAPSWADDAAPPRLVAAVNAFQTLCMRDTADYDATAAQADALKMSSIYDSVSHYAGGASERIRRWGGSDFEFSIDERIDKSIKTTICSIDINEISGNDAYKYISNFIKTDGNPTSAFAGIYNYCWFAEGGGHNTFCITELPKNNQKNSEISLRSSVRLR